MEKTKRQIWEELQRAMDLKDFKSVEAQSKELYLYLSEEAIVVPVMPEPVVQPTITKPKVIEPVVKKVTVKKKK